MVGLYDLRNGTINTVKGILTIFQTSEVVINMLKMFEALFTFLRRSRSMKKPNELWEMVITNNRKFTYIYKTTTYPITLLFSNSIEIFNY